jgi:hypothetical protein
MNALIQNDVVEPGALKHRQAWKKSFNIATELARPVAQP